MHTSRAMWRLTPAVVAAAVLFGLPAANSAAAPAGCGQWAKQTVASGYGVLENLAFDGRGNVLLSEQSMTGGPGALQRLDANGVRSVAVANVDGPGGIVVADDHAYFNTGNGMVAAMMGSSDGAIRALNLDTGAVSTIATGLQMPNGLALLPDGDFVVSKDIGAGTLTLVSRNGEKRPYAPNLSSTNGLAFDPVRQRLIVSTTFNPTSVVTSVDFRDPARSTLQVVIPGFGPLNSADDLTVGPDGNAYVTMNVAGQVQQVDPDTGATCVVAEGLPLSSSVRFGSGPGWDPNSLYVTSFLGTLTKLTPMATWQRVS